MFLVPLAYWAEKRLFAAAISCDVLSSYRQKNKRRILSGAWCCSMESVLFRKFVGSRYFPTIVAPARG